MVSTIQDGKHDGQRRLTVCVMGLGYIGLPTAAILAKFGHQVVGVDIRQEIVETINRGEIHIYEPGLGDLVNSVVSSGHLRASLSPVTADIFFICVPTPFQFDKSPDLSYVRAASKAIRPFVRQGCLVILESTSPPRTTEDVVASESIPDGLLVGRDVYVAHCPERVLPGRILHEVIANDRIVGGVTPACTRTAASFYEEFVAGDVLRTDAVTAELTKLIENSYRDVNIAFANEVSMLAEHLGANAFDVIELANRHPRVNILSPGPGVGGHCISVDPWFVAHAAPGHTPLIQTARAVNDAKPHFVVAQVREAASRFPSPVIGCLGLTYKSNVDDLRESPSLEIARSLNAADIGKVIACDPYVQAARVPDLVLLPLPDVIAQSDVVVLLTDHDEFCRLSSASLSDRCVIDTRGIWRGVSSQPTGRCHVAAA